MLASYRYIVARRTVVSLRRSKNLDDEPRAGGIIYSASNKRRVASALFPFALGKTRACKDSQITTLYPPKLNFSWCPYHMVGYRSFVIGEGTQLQEKTRSGPCRGQGQTRTGVGAS